MIDMPKLRPVPIKTLGKPLYLQLWTWLTSVRQWEIIENWHYTLPNGTHIIIPTGFVFDGASIPRIMWAILSPTGLLFIQGLVHDFAYRYDYLWEVAKDGKLRRYREGRGQKYWDKLFREVGEAVNGVTYIDRISWLALHLFGFMAWKKNRKCEAAEIMPTIKTPVHPGIFWII